MLLRVLRVVRIVTADIMIVIDWVLGNGHVCGRGWDFILRVVVRVVGDFWIEFAVVVSKPVVVRLGVAGKAPPCVVVHLNAVSSEEFRYWTCWPCLYIRV